jgi:16S rRNA (cytosine1402-N4)-methyltransferase
MDDGARGFSFMRDGPLDMRMDPSMPITAAELVNTLPPGELIRILREFGEEEGAPAIVRKIAQARAESPITTTGRFAEIVRSALRPRHGSRTDPATKSFQALRIAVNDELGALDALLASIGRTAERLAKGGADGSSTGGWLKPGARVGIISFHSLEDRQVKRAFAGWVGSGWATDVVGGAAEAGPDEIAENPRSRSAKFRAIRLTGVTAAVKSL